MRHLPNDFRIRTLYGVGQDWPITYEQLEPWYLQAEQEIGVAGDTDLGSPRSGPYPFPPAISINRSTTPFSRRVCKR